MTIHKFTKEKHTDYPKLDEMQQRIMSILYEYAGEVSVASVLGILDLAKDEVKEAAKDEL